MKLEDPEPVDHGKDHRRRTCIMEDKYMEAAMAYIEDLFAANAGGHDPGHAMRVYKVAMCLADHENGCDRMIVALAALLHDADDHKLFDTKNNENARTAAKCRIPLKG